MAVEEKVASATPHPSLSPGGRGQGEGTPSENVLRGDADAPRAWEPATRFYRQLHIAALSLLILVLLVHLLQTFAVVLQQLLVAVLICYLILPVHRWLVRHRFSGFFSYFVITFCVLAGSYILGSMIYASFEDLNTKMDVYRKNLVRVMDRASKEIPALDMHVVAEVVGGGTSFDAYLKGFEAELGTIFGFFGQVIVVLVYLVFILAEQTRLPKRIQRAFEHDQSQYIMSVLDRINNAISRYVTVKTFVSVLTGVLTYVVLKLFAVDYAVLWSVIAFLLHYVPYVGPVGAVILPSLLCLVQHESLWRAFAVLFLLNLVQTVIGYILEPLLFGKRLDLSPLVIIAALAFWATIWGVVGMILAIPMVVVFKTILENIADTRPLARMISDV